MMRCAVSSSNDVKPDETQAKRGGYRILTEMMITLGIPPDNSAAVTQATHREPGLVTGAR